MAIEKIQPRVAIDQSSALGTRVPSAPGASRRLIGLLKTEKA